MEAKIVGKKFEEKQDIYKASKYLQRYLLITERKTVTL